MATALVRTGTLWAAVGAHWGEPRQLADRPGGRRSAGQPSTWPVPAVAHLDPAIADRPLHFRRPRFGRPNANVAGRDGVNTMGGMSDTLAKSTFPSVSPAPGSTTPPVKRDYHTHEWSSGTRGGGKVPADFEWKSNPKQWQEENGAALDVDVAHGPGDRTAAPTENTAKK